ncbi:uncharacterized protein [Anabrus simplex]|uniref:uncharacterized protein n=1 Tax=Anabrus simplex TaxID=316456 RepID=UPI0035A2682F
MPCTIPDRDQRMKVSQSSLSWPQSGIRTSRLVKFKFLGQQVFSHLPTEQTWNLQTGKVLKLCCHLRGAGDTLGEFFVCIPHPRGGTGRSFQVFTMCVLPGW